MRTLLLDCGNTHLKWRIDDQSCRQDGGLVSSAEGIVAGLGSLELGAAIDRVALASVLGPGETDNAIEYCRTRWGVAPFVAKTVKRACGVTCVYSDPQRLGVDRWLAFIEVWSKYRRPACVVDCGSAVTVDLIASEGVHLGGFIVPGLRLGISGLLRGTEQVTVDYDMLLSSTTAFGKSTTEAVYHGAIFNLLAMIEKARAGLDAASVESPLLVLTGGDSALISKFIDVEHKVIADLVLDGLKTRMESFLSS